MFRALLCSSSGGQNCTVLHSIWYHHTETSEWSKITKIQFYKYEHIVVKCMYEFFYNKFYYCVLIFIELYFSNIILNSVRQHNYFVTQGNYIASILVILDHSLVSV